MTTFWTSDLHFGHVNIMKYCPQRFDYLSIHAPADFVNRVRTDPDSVTSREMAQYVPEMNEKLVSLWNSQVAPDDEVIIVGDVAMGKVDETIQHVRRLNGTKNLVMGNHDKPHPICVEADDKRERWEQVYTDVGFSDLAFTLRIDFDGVVAEVCHFPYEGDHSEDRYNADIIGRYVPTDEGLPLVHGHVHDLWQTRGRMFNVGIDAWDGRFFTEGEIGAYFRSIGYGQ